MNVNQDRARFDALLEVVAEQQAKGQEVPSAWMDQLRAFVAAHPEWLPAPPPPPAPPTPSVAVLPPPSAAQPFKPGERAAIILGEEIEPVVDAVIDVWAVRFCVFQSGGRLFEIAEPESDASQFSVGPPERPRTVVVNNIRARSLASAHCSFGQEKFTKDGTQKIDTVMPPEWIGNQIVNRPKYKKIPELKALASAPTLRFDGELISERGYDISTGIYLASDLKITLLDAPTQDDARAALAKLFDVVVDFDFVNEASKSVWASCVLSIVARHTFKGSLPMTVIDASSRGSGKTLLAQVASIIATGSKTPCMFYTRDDIEMDKRIVALSLAGDQIALLDNISGKLGSPSLDAALTSDMYKGRMLGKNEMTQLVSMRAVWIATGNGIVLGADTARRSLMVRLEPGQEHPEDRTGPRPGTVWKYPRLVDHVTRYRIELLTCALTIVKAYIKAGRPNLGLPPMGSFEGWSDTIRSAIVWAGAADPCMTTKDTREADLDDFALRRMVSCWPVADEVEVTSQSLIEWAETDPPLGSDMNKRNEFDNTRTVREMWRNSLLEWLPAKMGKDLPTPRDLGYALRTIKGTIVENFKIECGKPTKSGVPWKRVSVDGIPSSITTESGIRPQTFSVVR